MRTGRFNVEIDGVEVAGWQSVTLPSSYTEQQEHQESDDASTQLWGQTTFSPLTMERGGQPDDTRIFDWREQVRMGMVDEGRKEIAVALLDEEPSGGPGAGASQRGGS